MTDASTSIDDTPTTGQKFGAELIGTFVLVFFGCGAAIGSGLTGGDNSGYIVTGLTFGLTVVVMAYAVGRISGGHFNPAVTLGAALGGRLPWSAAPLYVGAQLVGGLLAGAALFGILHGFDGFTAEGHMAQNGFGDHGSGIAWWAAFALEALLTMIFLWVILAVTDARNESNAAMAGLTIGLALAMIHFASMFATGTSVNPARSIGVGVFAGTDAIVQLWLFIVAPLVGAAIAGLTYPLIFGQGAEPVAGSGLSFGGGQKQQLSYAPPAGYEQWQQGQQQWQAPAAPQQQWGQQPPAPPAPQQWGQQPPAQAAPPQWGQPQVQQPAPPPAQPPVPPPAQAPGQEWGQPIEDDGEDGRTQVRRPD